MTDNFVSNEIIVPGLTSAKVWACLIDTSKWPAYYSNALDIIFHDGKGPGLSMGSRFQFTTFGLIVQAEVTEFVPPAEGTPARIAWHGWIEGAPEKQLDVLHAWLFENLPGGRVRMHTQESQFGQPAREMAVTKPNPMLNAHQDWLEGLARAASR